MGTNAQQTLFPVSFASVGAVWFSLVFYFNSEFNVISAKKPGGITHLKTQSCIYHGTSVSFPPTFETWC